MTVQNGSGGVKITCLAAKGNDGGALGAVRAVGGGGLSTARAPSAWRPSAAPLRPQSGLTLMSSVQLRPASRAWSMYKESNTVHPFFRVQ